MLSFGDLRCSIIIIFQIFLPFHSRWYYSKPSMIIIIIIILPIKTFPWEYALKHIPSKFKDQAFLEKLKLSA